MGEYLTFILIPSQSTPISWKINRYIIAPRFRDALAAMWQLPEIQHWWLPNDEGYSEIIREIRTMSEERLNQPRDDFHENVRDMKSLFWKLSVDDQDDESTPSSTYSGIY